MEDCLSDFPLLEKILLPPLKSPSKNLIALKDACRLMTTSQINEKSTLLEVSVLPVGDDRIGSYIKELGVTLLTLFGGQTDVLCHSL